MSKPPIAYTTQLERVKTNQYFHQKDNMWNSPVHSSDKIFKFYLANQTQAGSSQPSDSLTNSSAHVKALPELSLKRLNDRKVLRESVSPRQLQARSRQVKHRSTFAEEEVAKRPSSVKHSFDNYVGLPTEKIKLVVNENTIRKEELCVKHIEDKLQAEVSAEAVRKFVVRQRREQLHSLLKHRQKTTTELERRAGVIKLRRGSQSTQFSGSRRIEELATPKPFKVWDPLSYNETSGLLIRDQKDVVGKLRHSSTGCIGQAYRPPRKLPPQASEASDTISALDAFEQRNGINREATE